MVSGRGIGKLGKQIDIALIPTDPRPEQQTRKRRGVLNAEALAEFRRIARDLLT